MTQKLFDQFLIVGLKNDSSDSFVPYVREVWPPSSTIVPNVALFCFPEDIDTNAVVELKKYGSSMLGSSFFFVLTDADGKQQLGFTKRVLMGTGLPQCICILTHCASARLFARILDVVEARLRVSWSAVQSFLGVLYSTPIPATGENIVVKTDPPMSFPRPSDTPTFADPSLAPSLLSTFTSAPMIQFFASLLFERRIIVISSKLDKISSCVQAAVAALQPFAWHHIFIPVLPKQLLDYCSAPMPFIVGLHKSLMLPLQKMPLNEVVFVDLDGDQVSSCPEDVAALPPTIIGPLRVVLEAATADVRRTGTTDYVAVANAFRHFFVKIFAGYRRFFVNSELNGAVTTRFDKEAFLSSPTMPKAVRKFLAAFSTSQMFERFIAEQEERTAMGTFEQETEAYYLSQSGASNFKTIAVERLSYLGQKYTSAVRNTLADSKLRLSSSSSFEKNSTPAQKPLPNIPPAVSSNRPSKPLPSLPQDELKAHTPVDRNKPLPVPPVGMQSNPMPRTPVHPPTQPTGFWDILESPQPQQGDDFFQPFIQAPSPQPPLSSFYFSPPPLKSRAATVASLPSQPNPPTGVALPPTQQHFNPFVVPPQTSNTPLQPTNPFFTPPPQPDGNIFTSFNLDMLAPTADTQSANSRTNPLFALSPTTEDDEFDYFLASRHQM